MTSEQWIRHMADVFLLNAKPGTTGSGNERGMESIAKFINDNEKREECQQSSANLASGCLFRKNSLRGIVIVSDENDSSSFPNAPSGSSAEDAVVAYNVKEGKAQLDGFFRTLDGTATGVNYFVVAIVNADLGIPATCTTASCNSGKTYDSLVKAMKQDTGNTIAKESRLFAIDSANYGTILDSIGQTIVSNVEELVPVSVFKLSSPPDVSLSISCHRRSFWDSDADHIEQYFDRWPRTADQESRYVAIFEFGAPADRLLPKR